MKAIILAAGSGRRLRIHKPKGMLNIGGKPLIEYSINNSLYRDCDLYKYPTKKQINTKSFTKSDSPFVFSNKISYYIDTPDKLIKFDNSFFVSEIANYPESEAFYSKTDENCGQKSMTKSYYFNDKSPDKFFMLIFNP